MADGPFDPDDVLERLEREPPAVLYHYCPPAALLGILQTKMLRATHIRFLNDTRELDHALDIANAEVASFTPERRRGTVARFKRRAQEQLEGARSRDVFVASFSQISDSLSQWRAYCRHGGFALGIDGPALKALVNEQGFGLVPCIYLPTEQSGLVRQLLLHADQTSQQLMQLTDRVEQDHLEDGLADEFVESVVRVAPTLKDMAFREEMEWRVISRQNPVALRVTHRSTDRMLIPQVEIDLAETNARVPLAELWVGPSKHQSQASHAAGTLLKAIGHTNRPIRQSHVPYRGDW